MRSRRIRLDWDSERQPETIWDRARPASDFRFTGYWSRSFGPQTALPTGAVIGLGKGEHNKNLTVSTLIL